MSIESPAGCLKPTEGTLRTDDDSLRAKQPKSTSDAKIGRKTPISAVNDGKEEHSEKKHHESATGASTLAATNFSES